MGAGAPFGLFGVVYVSNVGKTGVQLNLCYCVVAANTATFIVSKTISVIKRNNNAVSHVAFIVNVLDPQTCSDNFLKRFHVNFLWPFGVMPKSISLACMNSSIVLDTVKHFARFISFIL
jgi:hypothetical protein